MTDYKLEFALAEKWKNNCDYTAEELQSMVEKVYQIEVDSYDGDGVDRDYIALGFQELYYMTEEMADTLAELVVKKLKSTCTV